jgi:hypothetical protein
MGEILPPVSVDWDKPWSVTRLLTGDNLGSGYNIIPFPNNTWEVGFRPLQVMVTFNTLQDNLKLSYWITEKITSDRISQNFVNVVTIIGSGHTVTLNPVFTTKDIEHLFFLVVDSIDDPAPGKVEITNIQFGGDCFWKNLAGTNQICG